MINVQMPMTSQAPNSNKSKYDLEERSAKFGESVIGFSKSLPSNSINNPLINQFIRAGTSVGANYCEANEASSKKDFCHKISIARKEAKETMHWLRMISYANPDKKAECREIWKEAHELVLIFSAILRNR